MADGLAVAKANAVLNAIFGGTTYTAESALWVQLHTTGGPGAAGTTHVAGNSTRVNATSAFTAASASSGSITNSAAISWTSVSTSETYTDVTFWSASTSGTFICSGTITASAVTAGDNFSIPIGNLTCSLPVAS